VRRVGFVAAVLILIMLAQTPLTFSLVDGGSFSVGPQSSFPSGDDSVLVVEYIRSLYPNVNVTLLSNYTLTDQETGQEYTLVKVSVGEKEMTACINGGSKRITLDTSQIQEDYSAYLSSLPSSYRKMSGSLRMKIREKLGGLLDPASIRARGLSSETFRVIIFVNSAEALQELRSRVGLVTSDFRVWDSGSLQRDVTSGKSSNITGSPVSMKNVSEEPLRFISALLPVEDLLSLMSSDSVLSASLDEASETRRPQIYESLFEKYRELIVGLVIVAAILVVIAIWYWRRSRVRSG